MEKRIFIFQTGHAKGLAKAEIQSVLGDCIIDEVFDGFVVEAELQPSLIDKMGGIVRITEVIQSGPSRMPLNFEEWVIKAVSNEVEDTSGKTRYGVSMHPKSEKVLKKILIGSKKNLKAAGKSIRFVNKDFQNLSSVQAFHEGLLKAKAIELHIFTGEEKTYMTKTSSIQNFEFYSKRDFDRPSRSAANGMFPPKLAQILINLAKPEHTVFDPFCGSGTVMQEALLMGFEASGSDLSQKMVDDSEDNLNWLEVNSPAVKITEDKWKVFKADATKLAKEELPQNPFVVVTETWLGPALKHSLTALERPKVQREIEALYEEFFKNLKEIVTQPTTVVFTAAYHREGADRYFLPNLPTILAKYTQVIPLSDHERPSLFFERKQQHVSREIWKLTVNP